MVLKILSSLLLLLIVKKDLALQQLTAAFTLARRIPEELGASAEIHMC